MDAVIFYDLLDFVLVMVTLFYAQLFYIDRSFYFPVRLCIAKHHGTSPKL
ncbi:hypothetical protein N9056_00825 [bacterium]|nr:hypothetical protein [bacterium]